MLVESVRDYGIFLLDPDGHISSWNAGAERIKGYGADEIIGRHFSIFYPAEALARDLPGHELRVASEVGRFEDEGWRLRKDGGRFWANVIITALRTGSGELVGFAKVTRDLTERVAAEEQARRLAAEEAARAEAERRSAELLELSERLQEQAVELEVQREEAESLAEEVEQSNEQLMQALAQAEEARRSAETANEAKTQFLTVMSHELRTPLNAIAGYAELMALGVRGAVTPEQREDLARIIRNERHLLGVINDILNYAKLSSGRVEYNVQSVPLQPLLEEIQALLEPQLASRGLLFVSEIGDPSLTVLADRDKTRQILLNLLSNAIKYTEAGGRVSVTCAAAEGDARLTVRDTGVGIPEDKLQAVFEPFVQLDRKLTSGHEGTGLGLSISRDLARGMGGELSAEAVRGPGASFVLRLPLGTPPG